MQSWGFHSRSEDNGLAGGMKTGKTKHTHTHTHTHSHTYIKVF